MTAEIIKFASSAVPAPAYAVLQRFTLTQEEDCVCEACKPQGAPLPPQTSKTWTDDDLHSVRVKVGTYWDTFRFEVCRDSPLHAKMLALLRGQ